MGSRESASTFGRGGASRGLQGQAAGERGLAEEADPAGTQDRAASRVQALWRGKQAREQVQPMREERE